MGPARALDEQEKVRKNIFVCQTHFFGNHSVLRGQPVRPRTSEPAPNLHSLILGDVLIVDLIFCLGSDFNVV